MQNKDYAEIIRDAGYKMLEWDGVEKLPSEVEGMQQMLMDFYARAGKNPQDPGNFTNRLKLSADQEAELADLAIKFVNSNESDIDTYLDFLDDPGRKYQRQHYNLRTVEDVVTFLETANMIKSNIDVYLGLDSDQIRSLYQKGELKGKSAEYINKKIYKMNQKTGFTGDDLYRRLNNNIKKWKGVENARIPFNK